MVALMVARSQFSSWSPVRFSNGSTATSAGPDPTGVNEVDDEVSITRACFGKVPPQAANNTRQTRMGLYTFTMYLSCLKDRRQAKNTANPEIIPIKTPYNPPQYHQFSALSSYDFIVEITVFNV